MEYRKRNGDRLTPSEPLLRDEFDINDQIRAGNPRAISTFSLRARIFKLLISSGLRERMPELEIVGENSGTQDTSRRLLHKRREVMQCHGLRKFFSTSCTLEGLPPLTVEILMGHKALGVTGVYFKPTSKDLLEGNDKMPGYVDVMKSLTIAEEDKLKLKITSLEQKQDQIALMKLQHDKEMALMREEVKQEMKEQIAQLVGRLKPEIIGEAFS